MYNNDNTPTGNNATPSLPPEVVMGMLNAKYQELLAKMGFEAANYPATLEESVALHSDDDDSDIDEDWEDDITEDTQSASEDDDEDSDYEYEEEEQPISSNNKGQASTRKYKDDPNAWKPFNPAPNVYDLVETVDTIPEGIVLLPLYDKSPKFFRDPLRGGFRQNWNKELPGAENRELVKRHIAGIKSVKNASLHKGIYTEEDLYRSYSSGIGIATGEVSGQIFAIDVDGPTANVWLENISQGELPKTVEFTSGREGRRQLFYRVPAHLKSTLGERLKAFGIKKIRSKEDFPGGKAMNLLPFTVENEDSLREKAAKGEFNRYYECAKDEQGRYTEALEIRYNGKHSAIPPSRHPITGRYEWINSFEDCPIADMPSWLILLVEGWLTEIENENELKKQQSEQRIQKLQLIAAKRKDGNQSLTEFETLEEAIVAAYQILGFESAFNWAGHDWAEERDNGWTHGSCPRHASNSGTSFAVVTETGGWICHGCNDAHGNYIQYRAWREIGDPRPEGATWWKYANEVFQEAGITVKSKDKKQSKKKTKAPGEISKEEYNARNLKPELTQKEEDEKNRLKDEAAVAKREHEEQEYKAYQKRVTLNKKLAQRYYTCNENYLSNKTFAQFPTIKECRTTGQMLGLKAPKGTGKSTRIKQYIQQAKEDKWLVVSVTPRINLGLGQAHEWGIKWIGEDGVDEFIRGNRNDMSCCWDSLHKFCNMDYRNKQILFIIDEVESGLEHLSLSGTFKSKGNRAKVFSELHRMVSHIRLNGGLIIAADADLSQISLDYINTICGGIPTTVIENTFVQEKLEIPIFYGEHGNVSAYIKDALEFGLPFIVACDTKDLVKDYYDLAKRLLHNDPVKIEKIWCINADTAGDEDNQRRLKDINKAIQEEQPLAMFFSPTITVGVSINVDYFNEGFGIFRGTVTADVARQMVARNRAIIPWAIFADNEVNKRLKGEDTVTTSEGIARNWMQQTQAEAGILEWQTEKLLAEEDRDDSEKLCEALLINIRRMKQGDFDTENAEFKLYCDVLARRNFQMKHYHKCFVEGMKAEGWKVISKKGTKNGVHQELKELREKRFKEESEAIASADHTQIASVDEAKEILDKPSQNKELLPAANKVIIADKTGIDPGEIFLEIVQKVKFDYRYFHAVRYEWLLNNPEIAKLMGAKSLKKYLKDLALYGVGSAQDFSSQVREYEELKKMGLLNIIDVHDDEKVYSKKDFLPILDKLKFYKNDHMENWSVRSGLNLPRKDVKVKEGEKRPFARATFFNNPVSYIVKPTLAKLGYSFKQVKKGTKGKCFYAIPPEQINDPVRGAIQAGLTKKWLKSLEEQAFKQQAKSLLKETIEGKPAAQKQVEVAMPEVVKEELQVTASVAQPFQIELPV